jgi:hypothetical protein
MQQSCSSHADAGCCWLRVAGCSLLLAAAAGCWLLLVAAAAAASPGGIFEEFLKIFNFFFKKESKIFGDTLSRIVIDHKNDHPPPPSPPHPHIKHLGRSRSHLEKSLNPNKV